MATDRYIAALEISSSKVIGAVGAIGKSGQLEILAIEQERSSDSVRHGLVQNIEETSVLTNYVLERLERRPNIAPREITGVFVGLSGRSLRSIPIEVSITLPDETEINEDMIRRLKNKALEADIDSSLEIIDAIPRVFTVGRTETHRPKGRIGNSLGAVYDLIVARPALRNNLRRLIRERLEFDIDIKDIVITPIATADLVLNEHEKKLGCMFVDMGAETTSVTIYTKGNLVYYATLPMGGRNITFDLKALNIMEDKAEELKLHFGNAIAPAVQSQETVGPHKLSAISNYVVARAEEIVANIVEQVRFAGLTEKDLPEGIILCGGAARLQGMTDLVAKFSGMKVRMASYPSIIRMSDPNGMGLESLQISAIMLAGSKISDDTCLQLPPEPEPVVEQPSEPEETIEEKPERKKPKGSSFMNRLGKTFTKIFTPIAEDDEGEELS